MAEIRKHPVAFMKYLELGFQAKGCSWCFPKGTYNEL